MCDVAQREDAGFLRDLKGDVRVHQRRVVARPDPVEDRVVRAGNAFAKTFAARLAKFDGELKRALVFFRVARLLKRIEARHHKVEQRAVCLLR